MSTQTINGQPARFEKQQGWVKINREWKMEMR